MRGALALLLALGCGADDAAPDAAMDARPPDAAAADADADAAEPFAPDLYCPGSEACPEVADDTLYAGAAMRDITPVLDDSVDVMTVDTNGDGIWDPFDGDQFEDRNGNGRFDPVFIGGFGNPRPASGVHDPQWVRAIALRQGETTVVLIAADMFSIFIDDTDAIRALLSDADVDYVATCATHTHQGADTLGIYGLDESSSGVDPAYLDRIHRAAAEAAREALGDLRRAHVQYATFRLRDQPGGTLRYVSDSRHPRILDDEARVVRFLDASDDSTIATWINLGAHAEYWGSHNTLLSSDFPHELREGVESGTVGPSGEAVPGVGGMAAFCQGAIGAQIGPGEIEAQTWAGEPLPRHSLETMQTVGQQLAYFVLASLADGGGSITDATARLGFRSRGFFVDVQNRGFHIAILNGLFQRESYHWDPELLLQPGVNEPDVRTEVAVLDIGRLQVVWVPGELDPALFVGGYDGSFTPAGAPIVDEDTENPPDLSRAPGPPYLRDLARADADFVGVVSLGNDQLGYLLPDFDFVLDSRNPYIDQAPGEHYEETVAVGIDGWSRVGGQLRQLLEWSPR